jgi:hypothetical protein
MLEKDFLKYIPKLLSENIDDSGQALINYLNLTIPEWKKEIIELKYQKVPDRMISTLLDELGYYLQAGLKEDDTDRQKRIKIAYAVRSHKNRGTFQDDVKIKIDGITGENCFLYTDTYTSSAIFTGDGLISSSLYYSAMGADGIDTDLGIDFEGGINYKLAGFVWIDLGYTEDDVFYFEDDDSIITGDGTISGTTYYSTIGSDGIDTDLGMYIPGDQVIKDEIQDIIDKIIRDLQDSVPAYFRVFIGFTTNDGKFYILGEIT